METGERNRGCTNAWRMPCPAAHHGGSSLHSPLPFCYRLLSDLDNVDWADSIKEMQRNWIGRSEGATIRFALAPGEGSTVPAGERRWAGVWLILFWLLSACRLAATASAFPAGCYRLLTGCLPCCCCCCCRRPAGGVHHTARHAVWRNLHGGCARAPAAGAASV